MLFFVTKYQFCVGKELYKYCVDDSMGYRVKDLYKYCVDDIDAKESHVKENSTVVLQKT